MPFTPLKTFHELTFRIDSPPTLKSTGQAVIFTSNANDDDSSYWTVYLSRSGATISVRVDWCRSSLGTSYHRPDGASYSFMHLVPHNGQKSSVTFGISLPHTGGTTPLHGAINFDSVLFKDSIRFDIVLSTSLALAHTPEPAAPVAPLPAAPPPTTPNKLGIMLSLLKDVHSVDTCFIFTSDKSCSNLGLWAHSAILSHYKGFDELIKKAARVTSPEQGYKSEDSLDKSATIQPASDMAESLCAPTSPTIEIKGFSLATMCSILYYIYTGEARILVNTDQYAISKAESTLVLHDSMGKARESVRWDPLDVDSSWKLKDVTWGDLCLAAEYYGLDELRTRCEKEVLQLMDKSNVVDILFQVGLHVKEVKTQALNFIAVQMNSLFVDGQDPFKSFKDHPKCHEMLVEVMCLNASKKA